MLAQLRLQLAAIDNRIDNANFPLELQRLASARRNLFEQWCVLAGIPKPGSRRPGKEPQPMPKVEPMPSVEPVSPVAVAPVSSSHVAPIGAGPKPLLTPAA